MQRLPAWAVWVTCLWEENPAGDVSISSRAAKQVKAGFLGFVGLSFVASQTTLVDNGDKIVWTGQL